jgi:hypothetical protein
MDIRAVAPQPNPTGSLRHGYQLINRSLILGKRRFSKILGVQSALHTDRQNAGQSMWKKGKY